MLHAHKEFESNNMKNVRFNVYMTYAKLIKL